MNVVNPKEYLMQYRESAENTKKLTAHLAELREIAENLKDEEGKNVRLDNAVIELADTREKTAAELERLSHLRKEIISVIESVPNENHRVLLYQRYVLGKTWEQVAVTMGYSFRHTTKLHGAALKLVKDVLECPTSSVL